MPDGQGGGLLKAALDNISAYIGFVWFTLLALWGGTVAYFDKLRRTGRGFRFLELIGQWIASGFAGLMTAYVCAELGASFALSALAAGMAGNMSSQALALTRRWLTNKLPGDLGQSFERREDQKDRDEK